MNAGSHLKYGKFERVREMILEDGEYITNINHYNTGICFIYINYTIDIHLFIKIK